MTYQEVILNLSNSLVQYFDVVYHSAEILQIDNGRIPVINLKDDWKYLAPTDEEQHLYIRRNGDDEVMEELKLGSCTKAYKMRSQLRIVYFEDYAEKHNEIIANLLQSVLIGSTKLVRMVRDKWKLKKDESSGDYVFKPTTAYFAIDINVFWELKPDSCEEDFCATLDNPIKKCVTEIIESS
jgi:hypothetical protein